MNKQRLVAFGLLILSLAAALPVLLQRHRLEAANNQVDLVIETRSFQLLAEREGYPIEKLLRELVAVGVTGATVIERDLRTLDQSGAVGVRLGSEIKSMVAALANPHPLMKELVTRGTVSATRTYVFSDDRRRIDEVQATLKVRIPPESMTRFDYQGSAAGPLSVLELSISPEYTLVAGQYVTLPANPSLGFAEDEFKLVTQAGLRPVPRPRNRPTITEEAVREVFAQIDKYGPQTRSLIFEGGQILGNPKHLALTAEELLKRGIVPGLIESANQLAYTPQTGLDELARRLGYRTNRVYAMTQAEIDSERFSPGETIEKWVRAAVERNIRILYLRPFLRQQDPGRTLIETNMDRFGELASELKRTGLEPGPPKVFGEFFLGRLRWGAIGLGVVGAVMLWLTLVWPMPHWAFLGLTAVGGLGALALPYVLGDTGAQLLALAAAIILPTLGMTICFYRWNRGGRLIGAPGEAVDLRPGTLVGAAPTGFGLLVREGVIATVIMSGFSLIGGFMVASLLGDVRFLLEFLYFRGVKVAFFAPLALVPVSYVLVGRTGSLSERLRGILSDLRGYQQMVLTYGYVVLGLFAAVAAFWYIQRSGNQPLVPVPAWELRLRAWLEEVLLARPRTKEFAAGYPAMVLAVGMLVRGWRNWALPLSVAAVTAGVSVVNSFSHTRTPFLISLLRWAHGLWIGLILGIIGTAVLVWCMDWLVRQEGSERR